MERLDGSVRRALRSSGVPDAGLLAEVTRAWPAAVGAAIARAAWPQRLGRDGTLDAVAQRRLDLADGSDQRPELVGLERGRVIGPAQLPAQGEVLFDRDRAERRRGDRNRDAGTVVGIPDR